MIQFKKTTRRSVFLPLLSAAVLTTTYTISPNNSAINQRVDGPDKATIINVSKPVNHSTIFFRNVSFNFGIKQFPGGGITPDNANNTLTTSQSSISQVHQLGVPASATHAIGSNLPTITQYTLAIPDNAAHGQSSSIPILESIHTVVPVSLSHDQTSGLPNLLQSADAIVQSASHSQISSLPILGEAISLTVDSAVHSQASGLPTLGQTHSVNPDSLSNGQTSSLPTLLENASLIADSVSNATAASLPSISQTHTIVISGATHSQSATLPTLEETLNYDIIASGASHVTSASPASITEIFATSPDNISHVLSSGLSGLTEISSIIPDGTVHVSSSNPSTIEEIFLLSPIASSIDNSSSQPLLLESGSLTPADSSLGQTSSVVPIQQTTTLTVASCTHAISSTQIITDAAKRYWVGGTGSWTDATNHWALTSGGTAGAGNVPSRWHTVYIDALSGFGAGGTLTLDTSGAVCGSLTANSGHSYTVTSSDTPPDLSVYGSVSLDMGMTIGTLDLTFAGDGVGRTLNTNGVTLDDLSIGDSSGVVLLGNHLTLTGNLAVLGGSFDSSTFNVSAGTVNNTGAVLATIDLGSGTWTVTGSGLNAWYTDDGGTTIIPGTSTIKFTDASASAKTFSGGNKTYNNIWWTGAGTGNFVVAGDNTFNDFKVDTPPHNLYFNDGSTTTVTTFTVSGSAPANFITINSTAALLQHILVCNNYGFDITCDYLDISHSNAQGGVSWFAGPNSLDTTDNDGWKFTEVITPNGADVNQISGSPAISEIAAIVAFVPRIFRPLDKKTPWLGTAPIGGGGQAEEDLTENSATHSQTVSQPTITVTFSAITPDGCAHSQTVSESTLSSIFTITPDGSIITQTLDESILIMGSTVNGDNSSVGQSSSEPIVTQIGDIEPNDDSISQTVTEPIITSGVVAFIPRIFRPQTEMMPWLGTSPLAGEGRSQNDLSMWSADHDISTSQPTILVTLSVISPDSCIHSQTANGLGASDLTQIFDINPNDDSISQTVSQPTLGEISSVSANNCTVSQTVSPSILTEIVSFIPANSSISQTVSEPSLALSGNVISDSCSHSITDSGGSIAEISLVIPDNSSIGQSVTLPEVEMPGSVLPSNCSHSISDSGSLLVEIVSINPNNCQHSILDGGSSLVSIFAVSPIASSIDQTVSSPIISEFAGITILSDGADVNQTASSPTLTAIFSIVPDASTISQTSSQPSTGEAVTLTVNSASNSTISSSPTLEQIVSILPNSDTISQTVTPSTIAQTHEIISSGSDIDQTVSQPVVMVAGTIYPDNATHSISDRGGLFVFNLSPNDCEHDQTSSKPNIAQVINAETFYTTSSDNYFVTDKSDGYFVTNNSELYFVTKKIG